MYPNSMVTWFVRHRRRIVLWTAGYTSFVVVSAFFFGATCGFHGCPSVAQIRAYDHVTVPLDRIPDNVRNAFIAVEDRRFAQHHGIDWYAFGRALVRNAMSLGVREGASTLTMQVARSAFIAGDECGDRSMGRKLIELRLASRIESALSKDQILELYLNLIYLGDGAYGVEAASRHYFGKGVNRLTLSEAATLAALPRAPAVYDPQEHPDRAIERRNLVLSLMVREGFITPAQAEKATSQQLRLAGSPGNNSAGRSQRPSPGSTSSPDQPSGRGDGSVQQCSADPTPALARRVGRHP